MTTCPRCKGRGRVRVPFLLYAIALLCSIAGAAAFFHAIVFTGPRPAGEFLSGLIFGAMVVWYYHDPRFLRKCPACGATGLKSFKTTWRHFWYRDPRSISMFFAFCLLIILWGQPFMDQSRFYFARGRAMRECTAAGMSAEQVDEWLRIAFESGVSRSDPTLVHQVDHDKPGSDACLTAITDAVRRRD